MMDRMTAPGRSYSDLSDGATTFDPEEQFERDVDERMKGMSKEEAVARAICATTNIAMEGQTDEMFGNPDYIIPANKRLDGRAIALWELNLPQARSAITAADKWDAEQRPPAISPGLDSAIQDELDHPPASITREG